MRGGTANGAGGGRAVVEGAGVTVLTLDVLEASGEIAGALEGFVDGVPSSEGSGGLGGSMISSGAGGERFILGRRDVGC